MAEREIMTVPELSAYLRVHPSTIYRLLKYRRIPGFKIGSDWRFEKSAIDAWFTQRSLIDSRGERTLMPWHKNYNSSRSGRG